MFNILLTVFILMYIYYLYLDIISYSKPEKQKININIPEIPTLKAEKIQSSVIGEPKIWDLKYVKNIAILNKKIKQFENKCITYFFKKRGKIYTIELSTGKNLKFFGITEKENKKYAIFYDKSKKNKKVFLVKEGEKIDKFLILKKITNNNVVLENISNCKQKQIITLEILSVDIKKYKKKKEEIK